MDRHQNTNLETATQQMRIFELKKDYLDLPLMWREVIDLIDVSLYTDLKKIADKFDDLKSELQDMAIWLALEITTGRLSHQNISINCKLDIKESNWILGRVMSLIVEKRIKQGSIFL